VLSGERTSYETRAWTPTAAQHRTAYRFVRPFAAGRRVVEIGCGMGFGAKLLSEVAAEVLAIDSSASAIAAVRQSLDAANVTVRVGDAMTLSPDDMRCDLLVALQVIEHLPAPETFAAMAAEATRPRGLCILSTPNALLSVGENPYHVREYTAPEFEALLSNSFPSVHLYGVHGSHRARSYHARRRRLTRSLLRVDVFGLRRILPRAVTRRVADVLGLAVKLCLIRREPQTEATDWEGEYTVAEGNLDEALDLLAVCSHAGSGQ